MYFPSLKFNVKGHALAVLTFATIIAERERQKPYHSSGFSFVCQIVSAGILETFDFLIASFVSVELRPRKDLGAV
jgi:hypothetical protein